MFSLTKQFVLLFFSIRGQILNFYGLSSTFGMLIGFILGTFNFYVTPIFVTVLLILFGIVFISFPETPLFLLKENKITVRNSDEKIGLKT